MIAVSLATNGFITTRAVNERPANAATVLSKVSSVEVDSVGGAAGGAGVTAGGGVGAGAGGVWAEAVAGTASASNSARPALVIWPPGSGGPTPRRRQR